MLVIAALIACADPPPVAIDTSLASPDDARQEAGTCPRSAAWWRMHLDAWPARVLRLGQHDYGRDQLTRLLDREVWGDPSLGLAKQVVAARLNIDDGVDDALVADALVRAQLWLVGHDRNGLPFYVPGGRDVQALTSSLSAWNDGGCRGVTEP